MSDYGRIVTTNQGKNMVTESIRTHSAIIFTKISLGDGLLNGETIETMTGLKHRLMDGNVPKINHLGNGEIEAVSTVSNSELTAGFFARELGLFAKLGEEGEEQLFAYTNAGFNASYIPPNTSVDEKMLGIQLGVGDAIVQVNYQSHLYITYEQLEDGIAHHNNDANAHGGLLQNLKSQLTTHNTDISSHPAITDAIAKILGATNWQENPVATLKDIKTTLGMGGIVAQRLEENGFVKFANGFTIQWGVFRKVSESEQGGNWNENQKTRKFSIQFTTDKIILIVSDGGIYNKGTVKATAVSGAKSVRGRVLDKSSFKIAVDGSDNDDPCDVFFVALGV